MSVLRQRASADVAALPALAASLAAAVVVILGTVTGGSAGQVLLTAMTAGVLMVVLTKTAVRTVRPVPVPLHPSGVSGSVPAATAYWCALDAPRCPQRPRAPGRH
ncbi:hypothetical protein [Terracoccus sp. 273MFTsu3.1]|uniref:hypothetical protein n=1 Tax=Terracoccus sp. 273MFTsu3.1 TaxID=1172188 RepID=UPI000381B6F3|nr:hypothetical protein [Terracoccus sp. 273MFTsu3.1]